jgi:hypothetical protein
MISKFTKHPKEQGETYLQHMWGALKIVCLLETLALKCALHSIFPFLYTSAVSDKIQCLQKMATRANSDEEELYEVYGGD